MFEAFQLAKGTNEETPGLCIIMATSAETKQLVKLIVIFLIKIRVIYFFLKYGFNIVSSSYILYYPTYDGA